MNILEVFKRDEKMMDFEPLMPKVFEAGVPATGTAVIPEDARVLGPAELKTVDIKALACGE